jgi:hypothetical protein
MVLPDLAKQDVVTKSGRVRKQICFGSWTKEKLVSETDAVQQHRTRLYGL